MNVIASLKARQAAKKIVAGDTAAARQLYEEAIAAGLSDPRYLLSYSVLLIREGDFQAARELLVKHQKNPALTEDNKKQLFVNYAVCVYKLGELQKGIELLERLHAKEPSGLIYQTLGYLYIEAGDAEKALAYNEEALVYDEEDPISLDNLGQTYYRLLNDPEKALPYFQKAHEIKPSQIDTLYFLAQYDVQAGDREAARAKLETALNGRFSPLNYASRQTISDLLAKLA
ncbi:MAG: tetratricopeptide repeat protein [Clostridiales bacterium]|nr:tetratricopeptide repeat protein [Clostridiales bacterium]